MDLACAVAGKAILDCLICISHVVLEKTFTILFLEAVLHFIHGLKYEVVDINIVNSKAMSAMNCIP